MKYHPCLFKKNISQALPFVSRPSWRPNNGSPTDALLQLSAPMRRSRKRLANHGLAERTTPGMYTGTPCLTHEAMSNDDVDWGHQRANGGWGERGEPSHVDWQFADSGTGYARGHGLFREIQHCFQYNSTWNYNHNMHHTWYIVYACIHGHTYIIKTTLHTSNNAIENMCNTYYYIDHIYMYL